MLNTPRAYGGMVSAPHHLAAEAGLGILREGGNAVEAMVAAAAAIAVVYPHMNSLGGDGFWLISAPGAAPRPADPAEPVPDRDAERDDDEQQDRHRGHGADEEQRRQGARRFPPLPHDLSSSLRRP